jgi:protein involved in polysaccharide export with SLBB domain
VTDEANPNRVVIFRKARREKPGPQIRYPLWTGVSGETAVPLERADSVYVPAKLGYVRVAGSVNRPGYYPYRDGRKAADYIQMAGGITIETDSREIVILDRVSGLSRSATPGDVVYDGDEISVKEVVTQP